VIKATKGCCFQRVVLSCTVSTVSTVAVKLQKDGSNLLVTLFGT